MEWKYNSWRDELKLDCLFCGEEVMQFIEVISVSGSKDRKEAICLACIGVLRMLINEKRRQC